jgi:hypothetical protein
MWEAISLARPSLLPGIGLALLLGWAGMLVAFYLAVR